MTPPLRSDNANADEHFMRVALKLAQRGHGCVEPNPMVGCVIVRDRIAIGQGFHRQFGGPHAEVDALDSLDTSANAKGATAYVSLEPCCHHGKTPPCTSALIEAGIGRVVVAMKDPFPSVDGGGLRQLNDAGVETTVGVLGKEAEFLNAPYLKMVRTAVPWVIAKWAMTIDGRIATAGGQSQWITGPASRAEAHRLRGCVDAIVVGMGTVETDNPMLTARPPDVTTTVPRIAARIVFCQHRLPAIESKLLRSARQIPLMLVVGNQIRADRLQSIESSGAIIIDSRTNDPTQMVHHALESMGRRQMTNVMLEGGGELLASFFMARQIDECHVYIGPKAFGGVAARGPIGGCGIQQIADAWSLKLVSVDQFDDDLRVIYRRIDV